MKFVLFVGTGGFIGAVLRYLLSLWIIPKTNSVFPLSTLMVNITGCFLIGLLMGFCAKEQVPRAWELFIAAGILGGFTTFSAFSNETIFLFKEGSAGYALAYILSTVVLGLSATYVADLLVK